MSLKKSILSSLFVAMCLTQYAGPVQAAAAGNAAQETTQWLNNAELAASTGIQGTMASIQSNQYVVQGMQYAKETMIQIDGANRLIAMYANLTNPQWYLQKLYAIPAWQKGNQLYNVSTGTSSKSTRDAMNQTNSYASIMSGGVTGNGPPPTAAQLQAHNIAAASSAANVVVQANIKQEVLADQSKMADDIASGAAGACNGTNDCAKGQISLASVQTQVQIGTASTLASMQAAQAAETQQKATMKSYDLKQQDKYKEHMEQSTLSNNLMMGYPAQTSFFCSEQAVIAKRDLKFVAPSKMLNSIGCTINGDAL